MRWAKDTRATPDGRYDSDELSQSLNPSHFRNHEPLTTVLECLASIDLTAFAGNTVTNLCLDREHFSPDSVEALLRTFADLNLQLLQLNCMGREELEDARCHPEKHQSLMVRVCGFSAKFVSLCPEWQEGSHSPPEILTATVFHKTARGGPHPVVRSRLPSNEMRRAIPYCP